MTAPDAPAPHPDAPSPRDRAALIADNRANWNDRAAVHEASGYGIARLIEDPTHITTEVLQDRERLGDLAGKDVIHLQCHLGTDTMSLQRLGSARTVGLDLSPEAITRARRIAEQAGANIEYVVSDVYAAREAVTGDFDLVYTSLGVLCWLPDVAEWARVVASLLRPGGRFLIRDDHPMFMSIGEDVSTGFRIEQPYFQQEQPQTWDDDATYIETAEDAPEITHTVSHEWNHSIGEIITAVLEAGLVLDSFEETETAAWMPWPELMEPHGPGYRLTDRPERLPLQFVLTAHRPG